MNDDREYVTYHAGDPYVRFRDFKGNEPKWAQDIQPCPPDDIETSVEAGEAYWRGEKTASEVVKVIEAQAKAEVKRKTKR